MTNTGLEARFTDERYATRRDIVQAMHTSIIDSIYSSILSYRRQFSKRTSLKSISQVPLSLTCTPVIIEKIARFEKKINSYAEIVSSLSSFQIEKARFQRALLLDSLKGACKSEGFVASEASLNAMLTSFYKKESNQNEVLSSYCDILTSMLDSPVNPDEGFLAQCYERILGNGELTSFYRDSNPKTAFSNVIVGRVYDYAPFEVIPTMIDSLFSFMKDTSLSPFLKTSILLYYFNYIKPFDKHNALMGSLLAKAFLREHIGGAAVLLPLEDLLSSSDTLNDILSSCQKENDLTYFVFHCLDILSSSIDRYLDLAASIKTESVNEENVQEEVKEENVVKETPVEVVSAMETPLVKEREVKKEPIERVDHIEEIDNGERAFAYKKENTLSDKEIKEAAKYIMETNPSIKKAQALFYAGHCTIGRYYSIQDFKKSSHCAYETARTSMDALSRFGFYKKVAIKNKFVYTPLKQGEK